MADLPSTGSSNTPEAASAAAPTAPATSLLSPSPESPAATPPADPTAVAPVAPTTPDTKVEAAPVIPEKYEFKTPDDVVLDQKQIEAYTPVFKDLKLTNEQAQKLVELNISQYQAQVKAYEESQTRAQQQWLEDSKAQFPQHEIEVAQSAIAAFGGKDFVDLLQTMGVQNHPSVIRFARNVGVRLAEDTFDMGGQTPTQKRDPASVLYPNHGTKQ